MCSWTRVSNWNIEMMVMMVARMRMMKIIEMVIHNDVDNLMARKRIMKIITLMVVEMFMMMLKTWYMQSPSSAIDGLNISLILFGKLSVVAIRR